jgi:hypothetical protein
MASNTTTSKSKKAAKADTPPVETPDESLDTVLKAFDRAWDYTSSAWHDRWQDNYKLYNNERIKWGYKGISDTFVPMVFGTVETLTSALFGTKPKWGYIPPAEKANQNVDILNSLVDSFWDRDQWSMKIINTGRGMIREGTTVDYFCWDQDHPRLINVPIRDFFISPEAFELSESSTRYCGRRYLTTWDELNSYEIVDLEAEPDEDGDYPMKKKYKNLDKLKQLMTSTATTENNTQPVNSGAINQEQTTDKQEKDMFYGSTLDNAVEDQVEVIEYWTVEKIICIANRKVVIEDEENYYKAKDKANGAEYPRGLLPFAACRNYVDGSLFYAKSDVDFIADQQEDLNDFSNQMKDAVSFNLNQMKTLDPKYAHLLDKIQNLPGAVYPMEADMLVPIPNGQIPPEAFNERQNIKAEIRETTASNEVIKGAADTGKGNQTATEVNAQIAGAGQRIQLKVTQIENEYFHRMALIIFRMIQLYVTDKQMVRILGKDGVNWQEFDPSEFTGQYEPQVQLDISIQNKKEQEANEAANMLKAFLGDPNVNQQELTKLVLQRGFNLDPDEVDLLMTPQPPAPGAPGAIDPTTGQPVQAAVPGMPPQPGQPPMPGQPPVAGPPQPPVDDGRHSPTIGQPPVDPAQLAAALAGQV